MAGGRSHEYSVNLEWTGNLGEGTASYTSYARDFEVKIGDRSPISGSSDPAFRGDPNRYNPEELLVASLSACHMLWFLHLCSEAGIVVTEYSDHAAGSLELRAGQGKMSEVVLHPRVATTDSADAERAAALHGRAHDLCFVARSVNFPVRIEPAS